MTDRENLAREVAERLGLTLEGHTPGPWHLCENFRIFDPPNDVIFAAHVEDAIVCSMGENLPECKANARLIAAAPTLWNALLDSEEKGRKLKEIVVKVLKIQQSCDWHDDVSRGLDELAEQMKAALSGKG